MYAHKIKETPLSPVQKKSPLPTSNRLEQGNNNENSSWHKLGYVNESNIFNNPLQLCASPYNFNSDVIQLKDPEDQKVKITASDAYNDPTVEKLGLTCHHVIPQSLLKDFYIMCKKFYNNMFDETRYAFDYWVLTAIRSVNATSHLRSNKGVHSKHGTQEYKDEICSACQWMSGNLFIGPEASIRIDNMGDQFDVGGYREANIVQGDTIIEAGNARMDILLSLHDRIINIVNEYKDVNLGPDDEMYGNDCQEIEKILKILTKLAESQETIHKDNFGINPPVNQNTMTNNKPPAYDLKDWYSIGHKEIENMENKYISFLAMHDKYISLLSEEKHKEIEKNYINTWAKFVKNVDNWERRWTIARHTYKMLEYKYNQLISSTPR